MIDVLPIWSTATNSKQESFDVVDCFNGVSTQDLDCIDKSQILEMQKEIRTFEEARKKHMPRAKPHHETYAHLRRIETQTMWDTEDDEEWEEKRFTFESGWMLFQGKTSFAHGSCDPLSEDIKELDVSIKYKSAGKVETAEVDTNSVFPNPEIWILSTQGLQDRIDWCGECRWAANGFVCYAIAHWTVGLIPRQDQAL